MRRSSKVRTRIAVSLAAAGAGASRRRVRKYRPTGGTAGSSPGRCGPAPTCAYRTGPDRPGGTGTRGHVGHGRTGTARVTGSRAIISPRLVIASGTRRPPRPGLGPRPRRRADRPRRSRRPPSAPATRAVYRLLLMKGMTPTEAASLTAFMCGLPTTDLHWSLKQVNQLLFLRRMREIGRFGDPTEAPPARTDPAYITDRDGDPPPAVTIARPKRRRASSRRRFGASGPGMMAGHSGGPCVPGDWGSSPTR